MNFTESNASNVISNPIALDLIIKNDGFFPDVLISEFRVIQRTDGTVTDGRIREAIINSILEVNQQLDDLKVQKIEQGFTDLKSVPCSFIGDESRLIILYRRAVFELAKADLSEKYRNIGENKEGTKRGDEFNTQAEDHRRNARYAIADIKGRPRTFVELI